ncbi:class I SAM-dependent methyltransferase [Mycobacterium sp. M1]|uniref:Class I SAM-dependent methyltransferase n=1 Tax=Mycolicibacter acidiphilus TaxID=2835306 RepID=A0ABS5RGU4_9MYCO|nr:methyltransferase [Mycolicibacter acidiphilus]MBS9533501.1 class I SAM-dependent methyltransferase [Mycolicibacter acidiphilus]
MNVAVSLPSRVLWHALRIGARYLPDTASEAWTRREAARYWTAEYGVDWRANAHWRSGLGEKTWHEVGESHLRIYQLFAKAFRLPPWPRVMLEWGCGGGANAVTFAPIATRYIAADVSAQSTAECAAQVRAVCPTPVEERRIDLDQPRAAAAGLESQCDTFLCVYVIEATPGQADALEIVRIAESVLKPGGLAVIQVKYHTTDPLTRGRRRRSYRRRSALTTTFGIDEFWLRVQEIGLEPRLIHLVPRNDLDGRYAYFALTKP